MASGWRVLYANHLAQQETEALPPDIGAQFERLVRFIEEHGLLELQRTYVKHLDGKLWELRMKGRDGIARSIYLTAEGRTVIILHSFVKKTQKTPKAAIRIAKERAKEFLK